MTYKAGKIISLIVAVFSLLFAGVAPVYAAGETMYHYTKVPAFLEVGLNPNLLLLIDNSASMYDPAYGAPAGSSCYAADYATTTPYAGYFDPAADSWYVYDSTDRRFESVSAGAAASACSGATGDKYTAVDLCLTVNATLEPDVVTAFAAKGRFLNWLAASKFDVEKEILTGGKYNSTRKELVLEARGCLEERFVKQTPVSKGGTNYFAVFGIRPPKSTEETADLAYYGDPAIFATTSNTRIEIFKPSLTGFNATACDDAIAYWATDNANLGTLKTKTDACLGGNTSLLIASHTALNHILQECWYYKAKGDFQPGSGTVASLKKDCQDVYSTTPGSLPDPNYVPPGSLRVSDVCSGVYGPTPTRRWGYGYVGQCWEPAMAMVPDTCTSADMPQSTKTAVVDALGNYYYCDLGVDGDGNPNTGWYQQCDRKPHPATGNCAGGGWVVRKVEGAVPGVLDWTNDDMGLATSATSDDTGAGKSQGYTCIDNALRTYCQNLDDVTVVDPDVNDPLGTAWSLPAVLIGTAAEAQLGEPLTALEGKVYSTSAPNGLIHEFKYNLRMGAMKFNPGPLSECELQVRKKPDGNILYNTDGTIAYRASLYDCLDNEGGPITDASVPDPAKLDGGKVVREIDDGDVHVEKLVTAINTIVANAWTPLAEAYSEAVGYYTQRKSSRLNGGTGAPGTANDYICDQDAGLYSDWVANHIYNAGDRVKATWDYDDDGTNETKLYFTDAGGTSTAGAANIGKDLGVRWTPFDPVLAGCQSNNILIITDGGSTADLNPAMVAEVKVSGYNDGDTAKVYKSTLLGDVQELANYECKNPTDLHTLYGSSLLDDLSYYANDRTASALFVDASVGALAKKKIITYVVATGSLGEATTYECNPKTQLQQVAANSGTTLLESTDPAQLGDNLRNIFESIGGEPASGSAASVISNSRSGEGAIYQAVFYPKQIDGALREIKWAGDVHSLWLDDQGNIREDCGEINCTTQDFKLNLKKDNILEFYTDAVNNSARARRYSDADGDSVYGAKETPLELMLEDNIKLNSLRYIWSAGKWLSEASPLQKAAYTDTTTSRYIFTSANGTTAIPFTPGDLVSSLGAAYPGYFKATSAAQANDIVDYIRGTEIGSYRTRNIDWDGSGAKIWKLGDIVHSTPTVVSQPAEDYDLIYQDKSYQAFRQRYRDRRTVIYAGANDGGLHAFNGGYYERATQTFLKGPSGKAQYDLGAELWMFVPKNLWPHLNWLTDPSYVHVFYVDLKPYIFDAKIFAPEAICSTDALDAGCIHPNGWGTVMVAGMKFGGGNIGVDPDGDGTEEIMRSSYSILDITNPEDAPQLLGEFTRADLGFTTAAPTAIPMLRCKLKIDCPDDMPMDWYLAFGSGPHNALSPASALAGESDQLAKLFIYPLGGTNAFGGLGYVGSFVPDALGAPAVQVKTFSVADAATFSYSYFSDIIAVDYDLNFKTDALYFGSVDHANEGDHSKHTGAVHRLFTGEELNPVLTGEELDPANWRLNTFFATPGFQPVTAAPSVAMDGKRAWVYVGTGIYNSALHDKPVVVQQSYYGLKERYSGAGKLLLDLPNGGNLVDVSKVWVEEGDGTLHTHKSGFQFQPLTATDYADENLGVVTTLDATTFKELDLEIGQKYLDGTDKYHGWKLDFGWKYDPLDPLDADADGWVKDNDLLGERNLGQAAILGNIVTFTTFVPSTNTCVPEGNSYLWAPYYRTGTGYTRPVIGRWLWGDKNEVMRKISIGVGLATTPNIHSGGEEGTKAFVQTSTGAIISIEQNNPGVVKSGIQSWRELRN